MSITVEELIKKCKSNPKYDLSKHLKTKYIPYLYILACSTMHRYSIYIIDITIP